MYRSWILAGIIALTGVTQAAGEPPCQPKLTFKDVQFSEMRPPTLERKWTAIVSVDASRCVANSQGSFEVVFTRLKEYGVDLELRERFAWRAPLVNVAIDLWADEAVAWHRIDSVTPCRCAE